MFGFRFNRVRKHSSALIEVLLLLSLCLPSSAVTHFLEYLYTEVTGANIPEFTVVGLLDGERFVCYNSNLTKMIPQTEWIKNISSDNSHYWESETEKQQSEQDKFKYYLTLIKKIFNQTEGVHTLQSMYGCERDDNGTTRGHYQFGYNGEDFISLNLTSGNWIAAKQQAVIFIKEWDPEAVMGKDKKSYLETECIDWIKKFVNYANKTLERKDPPTASVFQKHSPAPEVVCHATGFFPKAVMISWKKDGEDVYKDVELRETLPNQNGSFQKRSILKVSAEELQKHTYTCVIQHSSLEKEMVLPVIINKPEKYNNGGSGKALIAVVSLVVLFLVVLAAYWKQKKSGERRTEADYSSVSQNPTHEEGL